jgi:hypothetical protein
MATDAGELSSYWGGASTAEELHCGWGCELPLDRREGGR